MMRKKETRPGAPTSERVKDPGQASRQGHVSIDHNTTAAAGRQSGIAELLSYGQENAVPLRQLVAWTGRNGRMVRRMIETERREGIPICSGETGYYLASNPSELRRFQASMIRRALEIVRTVRALDGTLQEMGGQTAFDLS